MSSPLDRSKYLGPQQFVPYLYVFSSAPTTTDIYQSNGSFYPVGDQGMSLGVNKTTGQLFYLQNYTFSGSATTANWVPLTSSAGTPGILKFKGEDGVETFPDGAGLMNISANVEPIATVPTEGSDLLFTKGPTTAVGQAAGSANFNVFFNPAEDLAAGSSAADKLDASGPASFNDAQFVVDANGFVSLIGSTTAAPILGVNVDANTPPGTDPVLAGATGNITVTGGTLAQGTGVPVRQNSLAANTFTTEVQIASAVAASDATNIGLSNFDSSQFSVDPNGFVQILSSSLGTSYPGLPSNLAFSKAVNTTTFTGYNGTALSSSNKATFWIQHPSTKSNLVQISLTNPWQVVDAGGAGDMNGNSFGTSSGAWASDMPWYIYLVVNDAATAGAIAFSRVPNLTVAPAAGLCATRGSAVATTQGSMYFLDEVILGVPTAPTVANFDGNPCVCVGGIRVQKAAANDWVIQTPDDSDGIGLFHENVAFTYPAVQNGAVAVTNANTHFIETAGFPAFNGQNYFYSINKNGLVEITLVMADLTANGVNANDIEITYPLKNLNQSNAVTGYFGGTAVAMRWHAIQRNGSALSSKFKFEGASAFMVNTDIGGGADAAYQFNVTTHYVADIA